ncbi:MAG: hypothetical protein M3340_14910 [Actinomycetota bacterium]|nr:hypothetical protein [Actinomycetota bacterium]
MEPNEPGTGLELVDVTDGRVRAALARVDAMSGEELRELVKDEDPSVVEAAEALIARRGAAQHEPI